MKYYKYKIPNLLFDIIGNPNMNFIPNVLYNQFLQIQSLISQLNSIGQLEKENISQLSQILLNPSLFNHQNHPINEEIGIKELRLNSELKPNSLDINKRKKIFQVNYPDRITLFTNSSGSPTINNEKEENYLFKKRRRQPRKYYKDNIRKKIKRDFFNNAVINKLNEKLKKNGSKLYFMRFPQSFVGDILRETNKLILDKTLGDIIESKEIINPKKNIDLNNYYHNLKVIKSEDISGNVEFQKILNKKYYELFEEYLNSDEFKINVINQLKKKQLKDDYIEKFIYISKHFIEFFSG